MFPELTTSEEVLARAAELRAGGLSWETVARELHLETEELRAQVRAAGASFRHLLAIARREVSDEACAEALFALRRELRTPGDKGRREAAEVILKVYMTRLRHRLKRGPATTGLPVDPVKAARRLEMERLVDFMSDHTDEELAKLAANVVPYLPPWDLPEDPPGGPKVPREPNPPSDPTCEGSRILASGG